MKLLTLLLTFFLINSNLFFAQTKSLRNAYKAFEESSFTEVQTQLNNYESELIEENKEAQKFKIKSIIDQYENQSLYYFINANLFNSESEYKNIDLALDNINLGLFEILNFQKLDNNRYLKSCEKFSICLDDYQNLQVTIDDQVFLYYTKDKDTAKINIFLIKWPNSKNVKYAELIKENVMIDAALMNKDLDALLNYINIFPNSDRLEEMKKEYQTIRFNNALNSNEIVLMEDFLWDFPDSENKAKALIFLEENYIKIAFQKNTIEELKYVLKKYPETIHKKRIEQEIEKLYYEKAKKSNLLFELEQFNIKYPSSIYKSEVDNEILNIKLNKAIEDENLEILKEFIKSSPNHDKSIEIADFISKVEERNLNALTYSGGYKGGLATYQYIENSNEERVLNGQFTFSGKPDIGWLGMIGRDRENYFDFLQNDQYMQTSIEDGVVVNDLISLSSLIRLMSDTTIGAKSFSPYDYCYMPLALLDNQNEQIEISGKYINGKKEGVWICHAGRSTIILNFQKDNLISGNYKSHDDEKFNSFFSNHYGETSFDFNDKGIVGTFKHSSEGFSITGEFDKNNQFIGSWKIIKPDLLEMTKVYSEGKLLNVKIKYFETGQITNRIVK